jgi:hypothetical protein
MDKQGYIDEENAIMLVGVTSQWGAVTPPIANSLEYCLDYFPGVEACVNDVIPAGHGGVPWGAVIDLETMTVINKEDDSDQYIDFLFSDIYQAIKEAHDN